MSVIPKGFDYRKGHSNAVASNVVAGDLDYLNAPTDFILSIKKFGLTVPETLVGFYGSNTQSMSVVKLDDATYTNLAVFESAKEFTYLGRKTPINGVNHISNRFYLDDYITFGDGNYDDITLGWGGSNLNSTEYADNIDTHGVADGGVIAIGFKGHLYEEILADTELMYTERLQGLRGTPFELEIDFSSVDYTADYTSVITPTDDTNYIIEHIYFESNGTDACNIAMQRVGTAHNIPLLDLNSIQEVLACADNISLLGGGFRAIYTLDPKLLLLSADMPLQIKEESASQIKMKLVGRKIPVDTW